MIIGIYPHNGIMHRNIIAELEAAKFSGMVLLPCITNNFRPSPVLRTGNHHLFLELQQKGPDVHAVDISSNAHWAGTGLVLFQQPAQLRLPAAAEQQPPAPLQEQHQQQQQLQQQQQQQQQPAVSEPRLYQEPQPAQLVQQQPQPHDGPLQLYNLWRSETAQDEASPSVPSSAMDIAGHTVMPDCSSKSVAATWSVVPAADGLGCDADMLELQQQGCDAEADAFVASLFNDDTASS